MLGDHQSISMPQEPLCSRKASFGEHALRLSIYFVALLKCTHSYLIVDQQIEEVAFPVI